MITIAVYPFENLSPDDAHDIYCRSICIDLITELSRFRQFQILDYQFLQTISSENNPPGEQVSSNYNVNGTFRESEGLVRVNAQLTDSNTGQLLWAERFEEKLEAIYGLQEDLLRRVVATLQLKVDQNLLARLPSRNQADLKAYEYWLRGFEELKRGDGDKITKCRILFENAIEVDPQFSLGYSGLSLTYFNEWSCHLWKRWDESSRKAKKYAQKAVELDPDNHLALMILGRTYLYEKEFEKAELNFLRSVSLNPNDAFTIVSVAFWLTYLGRTETSISLYEKAIRLNPMYADMYSSYGSQVYFEAGDFERSIALGKITPESGKWVDFPLFIGAAHYQLGEEREAIAEWEKFLTAFKEKIYEGEGDLKTEALKWHREINPYAGHTNLEPFWKFIEDAEHIDLVAEEKPVEDHASWRESDSHYRVSFRTKTVDVPRLKGVKDIVHLLANPKLQIASNELLGTTVHQSGVELVDKKAVVNYRKRLEELMHQMESARTDEDFVRLEKLEDEYDKLVDFLSAALGVNGRSKKVGATDEKSRTAVTWRIRSAIKKVAEVHPDLGAHLKNSIRTGSYCCYNPEVNITWELD